MKGTILYSSMTGNTKKLAEYLHESLKNTGAWDLVNMDTDSVDIKDSDAVLLGGWADTGNLNKKALETLRSLDLKDKKIGLFMTMGTRTQTEHGYYCAVNLRELLNEFNSVATPLGVQTLQGYIAPALMEHIEKMPESALSESIKVAVKDGVESYKEPTESDYHAIANFFRNQLF